MINSDLKEQEYVVALEEHNIICSLFSVISQVKTKEILCEYSIYFCNTVDEVIKMVK